MSLNNLNDLVHDWINELRLQRLYSEHTIASYSHDFENFKNFLASHFGRDVNLATLQNLKISDFRAWFSHRIQDGMQARSNVRALSALKSLFNFLARRNLINLDVIEAVKRPKLPHLLPKPIEENVILNFLNAPYFFEKDEDWITDRDRALYTLLYCTGLRISEALNLQLKDIDSEIKINGKGKKDRIVLLLPIAKERIKIYVDACPYDLHEGALFRGLRGKKLNASFVDIRLQKLRTIYGLPDHTSAHAFRHSFATHLVHEGADLRSVQELLGHESLSSTQIYTNIDDYDLLRIYNKTNPLQEKLHQ